MNKTEAVQNFQDILREYQAIKKPKYRHSNHEDMMAKHESLQEIKAYLKGNKIYHDLVNGVSQILSKLKKDKALTELSREQIWSNYSERGMNKTIRPYPKKKHNTDKFPIVWLSPLSFLRTLSTKISVVRIIGLSDNDSTISCCSSLAKVSYDSLATTVNVLILKNSLSKTEESILSPFLFTQILNPLPISCLLLMID